LIDIGRSLLVPFTVALLDVECPLSVLTIFFSKKGGNEFMSDQQIEKLEQEMKEMEKREAELDKKLQEIEALTTSLER